MTTISNSSVSFNSTDTRSDEMNSPIEKRISNLSVQTDEMQANAEFQELLDGQSLFLDYSYWNNQPIKSHCPQATASRGGPGIFNLASHILI